MWPKSKYIPPTDTCRRIPHGCQRQQNQIKFYLHVLSIPVQVFIKGRKYKLTTRVYAPKVYFNILTMQDRVIKVCRDHPICLLPYPAPRLSCNCMSQPPTSFPEAESHTHAQPSVTGEAKHIWVTCRKRICVSLYVCGTLGSICQNNSCDWMESQRLVDRMTDWRIANRETGWETFISKGSQRILINILLSKKVKMIHDTLIRVQGWKDSCWVHNGQFILSQTMSEILGRLDKAGAKMQNLYLLAKTQTENKQAVHCLHTQKGKCQRTKQRRTRHITSGWWAGRGIWIKIYREEPDD